jgi:hypothetical protein
MSNSTKIILSVQIAGTWAVPGASSDGNVLEHSDHQSRHCTWLITKVVIVLGSNSSCTLALTIEGHRNLDQSNSLAESCELMTFLIAGALCCLHKLQPNELSNISYFPARPAWPRVVVLASA